MVFGKFPPPRYDRLATADKAGAMTTAAIYATGYMSADQSIPNAAWTTVAFDLEVADTNAFHDNVINNARLTVPTGLGGVYLIWAVASFAVAPAGNYFLEIPVYNSAGVFQGPLSVAINNNVTQNPYQTRIAAAGVKAMNVGDYAVLMLYQTSGAALAAKANEMRFGLARLGS